MVSCGARIGAEYIAFIDVSALGRPKVPENLDLDVLLFVFICAAASLPDARGLLRDHPERTLAAGG